MSVPLAATATRSRSSPFPTSDHLEIGNSIPQDDRDDVNGRARPSDVLERLRLRLDEMCSSDDVAEGVYQRLVGELDWSEVEARSFADNRLSRS